MRGLGLLCIATAMALDSFENPLLTTSLNSLLMAANGGTQCLQCFDQNTVVAQPIECQQAKQEKCCKEMKQDKQKCQTQKVCQQECPPKNQCDDKSKDDSEDSDSDKKEHHRKKKNKSSKVKDSSDSDS